MKEPPPIPPRPYAPDKFEKGLKPGTRPRVVRKIDRADVGPFKRVDVEIIGSFNANGLSLLVSILKAMLDQIREEEEHEILGSNHSQ